MKMQQKSQAGKRNFLSGTLCPSSDISACGSRCGSTKNRKNKPAKKVEEYRRIPPESMDSSGILELLPRFELGTSSLPTDCQPREYRFPVLLGHFCYGEPWSLALSCPLTPPAFFRVWVTVWVKRISPCQKSHGWAAPQHFSLPSPAQN